ncbi:sulfur oxidation c-type cytochrome SoxA [Rhabdaerophilum sp. SD176]|uniref:sulfur oxidation c-type cytochrome SoxA n=1 Tax=Rhabdaerophilum sp. SD176 TaxID=2983548 RepID=UPI0024DF6E7B|nr:sulfur oxidation c-type cytochrome SoxA [Rhabdaerophilum sp. SD176]
MTGRAGRAFALAILLLGHALADDIPANQRLSGHDMMGAEAQAMQRDDFANPAMLAVKEGEALWKAAPGEGRPSCQSCHGDAAESMKGVAARYPARDASTGRAFDLPGQIQACQTGRQAVAPSARESAALLALEAYLSLQSRGMPLASPRARGLEDAVLRGEKLYRQRFGQLDLSCAQCHSQNWGRSLGGTRIPQAHPTGYPLFRMEWQAIGSLQRRFRNCMTGIRAEPFPAGAPEWVDLEIYLKERAADMAMDAPGVRP